MSVVRGVLLAVLTAILLLAWLGFLGFADHVHRARPPSPTPEADAIVALTGGTVTRLSTGMDLLAQGHGRRLLVSGVNPQVKDAELAALLKGPDALFACCVDVGRQAEDTLGNASETSAWAERNGFHRVIVVTDDYHMPRSLAELRIAMPGVELIAYPVATRASRPQVWQRDLGAAGRLAVEYGKYLAIRVRERLLAFDRPKLRDAPSA